MFQYKKLIISAFKVVLDNKYLWFFGFFAAFLVNGGFINQIYSGNNSGTMHNWQRLKETGVFDFSIINNIITLAQTDLSGLLLRITVLIVVLTLGLFIFWLAVVSQGALIKSVADIYNSKKSNFNLALKSGLVYFWPVFFFRLIERIIFMTIVALSGLIIVYSINYAQNLIFKVIFILIFVFLLLVAAFVFLSMRYAISFNIIENKRFIDAILAGLKLLRTNIFMSFEMGVAIFLINAFLGFMALIIMSAMAIPLLLLMYLFYNLAFVVGLNFVLIMGTLLLFVGVGWVGSVLITFNDALWTIFFINLSQERTVSRLSALIKFFTRQATG